MKNLGLEEVGVDFGPRESKHFRSGKNQRSGNLGLRRRYRPAHAGHAATREGIVAVNNMFGKKDRIRYHAIPSVIYTHPEVASVGSTEEELKAAGIEYKKSVVPMAVAGRFLVENEGGSGTVKVLAGVNYGEILGVHAIGDGSSEFIVAAVGNGGNGDVRLWRERNCISAPNGF